MVQRSLGSPTAWNQSSLPLSTHTDAEIQVMAQHLAEPGVLVLLTE